MDLGLAGKVVLVAGASRGIGLAIAKQLAAEGARVAIVARNEGTLRKAAETGLHPVVADMTVESDIRRTFERVERELGPVYGVVANLGSGRVAKDLQLPRADWEQALLTNLLGSMSLAAVAASHLCARKEGSITFVSSIAGLEAIGAPAAYAAAKAALQASVKNLAHELAGTGVRVNAVAPGNVLFPGGTWERKTNEDPEGVRKMLERDVPLRRFAQPEEIACVTAFIASPRASFVTGATWVVDGGQTRSYG